ncbi:MAG TPA: glycosyltransferase family 4 protein [Candidatus Dormibacteraeota bacterium]
MLFRLAPRPTAPLRVPRAASGDALRIALLVYRGNPRCGGQGVYVRHLSRALVDLGHRVEVFSGPPYPELDPDVGLTRVRGLDLYRQPDPFRLPRLGEFRSPLDVAEFGLMCTAGFPEPLTFSLRVQRLLRRRLDDFDVIHDNQGLGYGMLPLLRSGVAMVATIHHPITVDRRLDLEAARRPGKRLTTWRWYGFTRMQARVARRMPRILTVSDTSWRDLVDELNLDPARLHTVPLGVDTARFRPLRRRRVAGRLLTTASADVPLKGLLHLVEALPRVRLRHPHAHLVVIGSPNPDGPLPTALRRLGLQDSVRFERGVSDQRIVELYAEAEVAVVPSLYEGFSLPAVEAMASGCALVVSDTGALPEVVGRSGEAALLVRPGQPDQLAAALDAVLSDPDLRDRLGAGGRRRALEHFNWPATAVATVAHYRAAIAAHPRC